MNSPPAGTGRRRFVVGTSAALLAATPMRRLMAMARKPPVQGIHEVAGEVRVNGASAGVGAPVAPGDTVETGDGSRVIYVVGRSVFLQREQTRVELEPSAEEGLEASDNAFLHAMRVLAGKLLSVHARGELSVETPNGGIGIRGTGLYIDARDARTYVCVCYGRADLFSPGGERLETVRTRHHESPRYLYPAGAATAITEAPVVDHGDDELILLESLAGRRPPFVDDAGRSVY